MIRILCLIAALFTLSACKEGGPTASVETTPGGIDYTLLHMPDHEDVTIHIAWATDWAYRPDTNKAVPYIGADLILIGGAEGYPAGEVQEYFADLNSEGVLYVSANDHVIGELTFERDHMDETIAIANAHLRAPRLDQRAFDRLREGLAANMAEAQSQPAHAGFDAVRWAVFGAQPLRNALSMDDPETFESLTRTDVVAWHGETITRNPAGIVVAGTIDSKSAGAAIDALLDGLPEGARETRREATPDYMPRRILLHRPDAQTTTLSFIGPIPPTNLGHEMEDLLLVHALGGDDQSVLFDAIRTELRASYGFSAGITNYTRNHRILYMTGEVETAKLAEAEQAVREAYQAFLQAGPLGELAERKAPFEADFGELSEYLIDQARSELQGLLDGYEPGRSLKLTEKLAAVTEESLAARLTSVFPAQANLIMMAVSPRADALADVCVIETPAEASNCP